MKAVLELLPGMTNVHSLNRALGYHEWEARLAAAEILARIEGNQAEESLLRALDDSDARVRWLAASELSSRGRPEGQRVVESFPCLGSFNTIYRMGDDTYDVSFSIETDDGEFLGECGVGISEVISEEKPAKVVAFEVWLFGKYDIRTVTKVLMSVHAFSDEALRAELANKGELVLARPGRVLQLLLDRLFVTAHIKEMNYGTDKGLPSSSFIEKLEIELVARSYVAAPGERSYVAAPGEKPGTEPRRGFLGTIRRVLGE